MKREKQTMARQNYDFFFLFLQERPIVVGRMGLPTKQTNKLAPNE